MLDRAQLADISRSESLEGAKALHAEAYNSDDMMAIEREAIFKSSWQYVGHVSQLPDIGSVIATEIAEIPLVIVRNHEGIQCFANVCKHRAGPLITENGKVHNLRCQYHGWTYDLAGQLIVAPEMADSFRACDVHLTSYACEVWQGYIFVYLGDEASELNTIFQGIVEHIKPIDLSAMTFHHRDSYLVQCNWKVYMDNYLEGYHLPYVHPGLSKLLDYRSYDTTLFDWYSYQSSPLQGGDNFYGEGEAHYYCVYPNLMLNILPGRCQVNIITPVAHDQCRVDFDYYYAEKESEQTNRLISQDLDFSDEIQQEDIDICEKVQNGLQSGTYIAGYLCQKREQGVWHFQELIRSAYRSWLSKQNHPLTD